MIALEQYGGGASPALEQTVSESIQTGFGDFAPTEFATSVGALNDAVQGMLDLAQFPALDFHEA